MKTRMAFKKIHAQDMRFGQILHVNIVTNTSPIRYLQVIAKDLDAGVNTKRRFENNRNQVGLWLMRFPGLTTLVGPAALEYRKVTQYS